MVYRSCPGLPNRRSVFESRCPLQFYFREIGKSGCSRSPWTREIAGSNPAFPTNFMWTAIQHRQKRREQAITYLGGECRHCGNSDERVLEFHHATERRKNGLTIAALFGGSWARLKTQLDKCDLLCANCHKIETLQQEKHIGESSSG